ncbi:MAG: hypothetical protein WKF97_08335 [Chitinophagaceae bacterium]
MSVKTQTRIKVPVRIVATSFAMNIRGNSYHQKLLISHLRSGRSINFLQAMDLGISFLNERIRVLQHQMTLYSRTVQIGKIKCKEYSLVKFNSHS